MIHAISRDLASFPRECIFCQLDVDLMPSLMSDGAGGEDDADVPADVDDVVRLVPDDKSARMALSLAQFPLGLLKIPCVYGSGRHL